MSCLLGPLRGCSKAQSRFLWSCSLFPEANESFRFLTGWEGIGEEGAGGDPAAWSLGQGRERGLGASHSLCSLSSGPTFGSVPSLPSAVAGVAWLFFRE